MPSNYPNRAYSASPLQEEVINLLLEVASRKNTLRLREILMSEESSSAIKTMTLMGLKRNLSAVDFRLLLSEIKVVFSDDLLLSKIVQSYQEET